MREANTHFKGGSRRARRTRAGMREARESCYQSAAYSKKPRHNREANV